MRWIKYFFEALQNYQRVKDSLDTATEELETLRATLDEIEKFIETKTNEVPTNISEV